MRRAPITLLSLALPALCGAQAEVREVPPLKVGAAGTPPRGPGGIVAIVNDDVITQAELEKLVERRRAELSRRLPPSVLDREFLRIVYLQLERLIDDKLILQLIKKDEEKEKRPYVSEAEVDAEIMEEVERQKPNGITSPEDFYRLARERDGDTREELRTMIRNRIAVNNYLWRNVLHTQGVVSPQESRAYYKKHMKDFSTPVAIFFHEIMVRITRDNRPEEIVKRIEKGIAEKVPFVELAKQYDADAIDGDPEFAGRLKKKTLEELKHWKEPIPTILRSLKKGEISERVVTHDSVHFFEVVDIEEGKPKLYSEVQDEIARRIRQARNDELLDEFLGKIRKRGRIEVFLPPFPEAGKLTRPGDKAAPKREGESAATPAEPGLPSAPPRGGSAGEKDAEPAVPRPKGD